jgi:FkbM family methyltransferase
MLAWYGAVLPQHRGKWRILESALKCGGLESGYDGPVVAMRRGRNLELDLNCHIDRIIYYQNSYEAWDTLFLETVIQPGWVVLDIGANIGWYSLMASKKVGSDGKIFAFDISLDEMKKLKRNVELNQLTTVEPLLIAMSDKPGKVFITETKSAGTTSLATAAQQGTIEIEATSLDHFVAQRQITRLDLIKIDIEGAEVGFLAGGKQSLQRFQPVLMMELNPGALGRFGHGLETVMNVFKSHGYHLFKTGRHGLIPLLNLPREGEYLNTIALPKHMAKMDASFTWQSISQLGAKQRQ